MKPLDAHRSVRYCQVRKMSDEHYSKAMELLQAIAERGGIDAFDALRHLLSPTTPIRFLEPRDGLLQHILECLRSERNSVHDRRLKEILWDARAATLTCRELAADERFSRLEALDLIGRYLFANVQPRLF